MTFPLAVVIIYAMFSLSAILIRVDAKWYDSLNKPFWVPSSSFAILIWPAIHALVGLSIAIVYEQTGKFHTMTGFYLIALLTNYLSHQSCPFFLYTCKDLQVAFWNNLTAAGTACLLILATIPYSKAAAWLLFPYLLFQCFTAFSAWIHYRYNLTAAQ